MEFITVQTRIMLPPQDSIFPVLDESLPLLQDGDVLFITSKILGIHQGRCVKMGTIEKDELIHKEADASLPSRLGPHNFLLTIKDNTLIPSAGIDESNGNGYYILWPENTNELLKEIHTYLTKKFEIKNLALVSTDSHTMPLRWGVIGISTGFYGMKPMVDYRGKPDIFGRPFAFSQSNVVDSLSAMAVFLMGEGDERKPMVICRGADFVEFTTEDTYRDLVIEPEMDIYNPIFKDFKKRG